MTVTLNEAQMFALAEVFANDVLSAIRSRNQQLVGGCGGLSVAELVAPVRASVLSIPCPLDRQVFVGHLRWHLDTLRRETSTHVRGRDYVAAVRAYADRVEEKDEEGQP